MLLITAQQILPHADAAPLIDHAVAVDADQIVAVAPQAALRSRYPQAHVHDGSAALLTPAFVNAYDYGFGLSPFRRGIADDLLEVWALQRASLPPLDPFTCAAYSAAQLARAGVGLSVHRHLPHDWAHLAAAATATLAGYQAVGVRVAWHAAYADQPQPVYADLAHFRSRLPPSLRSAITTWPAPPALPSDAYVALICELAQHNSPHAQIQLGLETLLWCSDALLLAVAQAAQQHLLRVQMPGAPSRYQSMAAPRRWGQQLSERLATHDLLGPWLTLQQPIWMGSSVIAQLAQAGVAVAYAPGASLRQRAGIAPLAEIMQHNLALGIGLGGQSLADDHDYLAEVRLAWRSANRPGADEPTIHARDLFHCATHGGAQAVLGSNTQLGRIVPGAPADLVLHEAVTILGHEQTTDAERLTALIIQRGGVRSVRDVLIGGRWVVRDGTVLGVDLPTLTAQLTAEAAQIPTAAAQQNATQAQALAPYLRRFYAAWEAELMSD